MDDSTTERLRVRFSNLRAGWLDVELASGDVEWVLRASYVLDPLARLATAATDVIRGQRCVTFSWLHEPGFYHWQIDTDDDGLTTVWIWMQDDSFERRGPTARQLLELTTTPEEFTRAVLRALDQVRHELGYDQFAGDYGLAFPDEQVEGLRTAFRSAKQ